MPTLVRSLCVIATAVLFVSTADAQDRGRERGRGMRGPDPLTKALDVDDDRELSPEEIDGAHTALLSLDRNDDGNLTADELTPPSQDGRRGGPSGPGGGFARMRRMTPIMRGLDKDGDGELFEDEVTGARESLLALDANGDGRLAGDEIAPRGFGRGGPPGGRGGRGDRGRRDGGNREAAGPVPAPSELGPEDGTDSIPDWTTFVELSYEGPEVLVDTHLAGVKFVKFQIEDAGTDAPRLYFMNTKTHRGHPMFMNAIGLQRGGEGQMRGVIVHRPMLKSPSGGNGLYTFEFEPNDDYGFEMIQIAYQLLQAYAPLLEGHLAFNLLPRAKEVYLEEVDLYDAARLPVFDEDEHLYADIGFLPLHAASSFGRLRLMQLDERPGPRDIVLYASLPNEMPRVAGVITAFRQTPLSHVNLRAVQDDVPNAFIAGAIEDPAIAGLIGKYVAYTVRDDGYEIRAASGDEVDAHFAALRPASAQRPPRDLAVKTIRPFDEIGFDDAPSVGVKAANLATLGTLGLRDGLTPSGYAVPFAFYDAFMQYNGFYDMASTMIGTHDFKQNAATREQSLDRFRKAIKKGSMPDWILEALTDVQRRFPTGVSIRCRSSTNNEDLPGFSGAGLYDSFTHHPDEGHLSKSIRQVFASLWNFRAYEEREFYRIDHFAAAMGVVLHPNTSNERANGVGVTRDILYQTGDQLGGVRYYVNAQVGEDLVTNPGSGSIPEEILLSPRNPRTDRLIRRSNRVVGTERVLTDAHLLELRRAMRAIHDRFETLYGSEAGEGFAMEVEFKVLSDGTLFIKQARPWVE